MSDFTNLYKRFEIERKNIFCQMPSQKLARDFIDEYINFLFPVNLGRNMSKEESLAIYQSLQYKFKELLAPVKEKLEHDIDAIASSFFPKTQDIYDKLMKDAKAICRFDPAANSLAEVIVAYPGFLAITVYRIAHELYKLKIPILPRLISEYAHTKTGIDINPGATIGDYFFIDHGTGIVIGETTIIKDNVKIYQGVTLGALSVEKSMAQSKRHPTIEDNVIIYANSTILGGETVIGHDCIIGGNSWITENVPAYSLVFTKNETIVRSKKS